MVHLHHYLVTKVIEITSYYELDLVVDMLVDHYLRDDHDDSNDQFLDNVNKIRSQYFVDSKRSKLSLTMNEEL